MNIDKSKPVMITGATGYLGGRIAEKFLSNGITVHAPVRDASNAKKTRHLQDLADKHKAKIKFFSADLLTPGSYTEAMQGCELVVHAASPFMNQFKDAQKELVEPALKGTENVLTSVNNTPSVKRVVLTSSCAAIYGDAKDLLDYPSHTITEDIWNTTSSLKKSPYSYSKTLAEKKAWEMVEAQSRWDLVVINPSLIVGPGIKVHQGSESYKLMKQMGDGTMKMGGPDLSIGCVDVRDVAEAHYRAAFTPQAEGRHICSAENSNFLTIASYLQEEHSNYPLPKRSLPKWLMWLMGPMSGVTRQFVKDNMGYPWKADNSKIKKELGMEFRPISKSVNEMFSQMIEAGVLPKK
jgi:nucleoside-diphosphate-sugar epimerase